MLGWVTSLPFVTRLQRQGRQALLSSTLLLWVILALALVLRLHGLNWDQGYGFHPDERSIYMRAGCMYDLLAEAPGYQACLVDHPQTQPGLPSLSVLLDPNRSPLNPHWFPLGSVLIYILVYARAIIELFGDFTALDLRYVGRPLSALADVGSVYLVYLLGRRMYGRGVGLLAAALTALAVIHIQNSHFYRPETFSAFFTLAAFWGMLRMAQHRRWRDSALLGLLVGLALAPKVNVLPLLLPLALAYLYRFRDSLGGHAAVRPSGAAAQTLAHASLAAVVALGAFFATSPYALLDFKSFVAEQAAQANMARHAGLWPFTIQYIGTPPFLYQMRQSIVWGLGIPLGIIAWASIPLTAALAYWHRHTRRADLLLLAWVVPSLLLLESFQVRFLRYLFPLIPFMLLMGARVMLWLVDLARARSTATAPVPDGTPPGEGPPPPPSPRLAKRKERGVRGDFPRHGWITPVLDKYLPWLAAALVVLVVAATAFYTLAFQRIYSREHPAVAASRWINENVSEKTAFVSDNHWDEYLPNLYRYTVWQFPAYNPDTPEKMTDLSRRLSGSEYVVFYSHRPYVSVARAPQRFPLTAAYYQQLFRGELGYRLERRFTSYPQLLGVAFQDNPFPDAGLPPPQPDAPDLDAPLLALDLGYADDNVAGYDHPTVLVFRNIAHLSQAELSRRLDGPAPEDAATGLMLSPEQKAAQRAGGTWSQIIHRNGWASRWPVLAWLLAVEAIYLVSLPLAMFLFRPLPDRGIVLARILGLLAVSYVAWLAVSLGWLPFSRSAILVGFAAVASLSWVALAATWRDTLAFLRARWRLLLLGEVLFLTAFLAFTAVRAANPDLWHPFRGGEKPMELAYLNAVVRSTVMPPYDPWFAGGYLNYYYWGYFVVAVLVRITALLPTTAFNLAVPLFFALTCAGAYSLVYNLVEGARRPERGDEPPSAPLCKGGRRGISSPVPPPIWAGLLAALFVAVIGNLDGVVQLVQGVWQKFVLGQGFPAFDFWRSSRMLPELPSVDPSLLTFWLPDQGAGIVQTSPHITEFPFFTFLFADLHPHLMVIPFTLLVAGLGMAVAVGASRARLPWVMAVGLALAVSLGALGAINSWDYPSYLLLTLGLLSLAVWSRPGSLAVRLGWWCALAAGITALSLLAYYPFLRDYETFDAGLAVSLWSTPLDRYLGIHGLFLFIVITFLVSQPWSGFGHRVAGVLRRRKSPNPVKRIGFRPWRAVIPALALAAAGLFLLAGYWTAALLVGMLVLAMWVAWRVLTGAEPTPVKQFRLAPLVFLALALGIGIGVDLVRLQGDIGRMNTLFKYYLEAWVLLSLASAAMLANLLQGSFLRRRWAAGLWLGALALLLAGSLIYTVLGTRSRLADRFAILPLTLDGTAYMAQAVRLEEKQPVALKGDVAAIRWLQDNVVGSPVVLEAHHEQYHWSGRISSYTGLPTVLGWPWHQIQQRTPYEMTIRTRAADVTQMYNTASIPRAEALLRQYEVRYIVVGELERAYYSPQGLEKFGEMASRGLIRLVYQDPMAQIFEIQW